MKKYIKSDIDSIQYKRERLAQDIDRYESDYYPYEYMDEYGVYEGSQESVDDILQELLTGYENEYIKLLKNDIEENSNKPEMINDAKDLIKRIEELRYK